MEKTRLIIGSRSSKLAITQTRFVAKTLLGIFPDLKVEIKTIKTTGDKILDVALSKIGDKGLFTKEIEEALLRDEIDLAVHSMKDLPTEIPAGLRIGAVTERLDPADILVSENGLKLEDLPKGSNIGTSSLRRRAQLLNMRDDLNILDLRGNLDTRIRKLREGEYDAIVVAYAGVRRLGLDLQMSAFPIGSVLPQAGQGSLGIEVRQKDVEVNDIVSALDDTDSRLCVEGERALLAALEGGCQVPIGVYAHVEGDKIKIAGGVFSLDGRRSVKDEVAGGKNDARALGNELAEKLIKNGAMEILSAVRGQS